MLVLALVACAGSGPDTKATPEDTGPTGPAETGFGLDHPEQPLGEDATSDDAFGTQLCLADETVVVVYQQYLVDDDVDALYVTVSADLGDTWSETPTRLAVDADVRNASLHCDDGGVVVVWEDVRDGVDANHQIYSNRSLDGGLTWMSQDVRIDADPDGLAMSLEPQLAAGGGGLVVVFYDNTEGAYDIYAARSDDGGASWSTPVRVDSGDPGSAYSARPQVAVSDDGGEVWVAWEDSRDGRSDIYAARSSDGGLTFEPDVRLDTGDPAGASDSFEPQLCSDGQGELYVVWHDARSGVDADRDVHASWSDDGGLTWLSTDVRVDTGSAVPSNALFPQCLVVDGALHVVWQENKSGAYDIYHRTLVSGVPIGNEERLDLGDSPGAADSLEPAIRTDGTHVLVTWREGRADTDESSLTDPYFNVARVGGGFDTTDHSISTILGQTPTFDLDAAVRDGAVLATWTEVHFGRAIPHFRRLSLP